MAVLNYCAVLKPYSVRIFFASSEFFSHSLNFFAVSGELVERLCLVHVLGVCGDEQVGGCALLNLVDELCGAFVDEGDVYAGVGGFVCLFKVCTCVVQGGGGKDFDLAGGSLATR